jgi:hypothetical protein
MTGAAALRAVSSRAFDGLAPEHRAALDAAGVEPEVARRALLRSVSPVALRWLFGSCPTEVTSGLLFPFRSPRLGFAPFARVALFAHDPGRESAALARLYPRPRRTRLYFAPYRLSAVMGSDEPLVVCPSEIGALRVGPILKRATVGLVSGREGYCWAAQRLARVGIGRGRRITLLGPRAWARCPSVRRFGRALDALGARVDVAEIEPALRSPWP